MKNATVSAGLARNFLQYAVDKGTSKASLLARSQLTEVALQDQDARVSMLAYQSLIEAAVDLTGDQAIAVRFSVETRIETISIVGLIVHSARSMPDAMTQLNRYAKLVVEVDVMAAAERFSVVPANKQIWIVDNRPNPNEFPALGEMAFGRFIGEFRRHFPEMVFALAVELTHAEPLYAAKLAEILRVPVSFGCPRNAMQIAPQVLAAEFDEPNAYVFGLFAERADALLAELERNPTLRSRIEAYLIKHLHRGEVTMEVVAIELAMSRQTLYRRLREEGVTFAQIHDDLRRQMALDYLGAKKASVNETAYLVGFSEASGFVRAFRRWTGMTPLAFRSEP